MSVPPTDCAPEDIPVLLKKLATRGLLMWSVVDDCRDLLALRGVQAHMAPEADRSYDNLFEALASYLQDAIARVEKMQYQRLLTIVLAVEPQHRQTSAKHRRTVAGQEFRGADMLPVTHGNIRQHHEPKAIAALAQIVADDELSLQSGDGGDGDGG